MDISVVGVDVRLGTFFLTTEMIVSSDHKHMKL